VSGLVYDASGPEPLVWDSFSRADGAEPGVSETGQAWRLHSSDLSISGGAAAPGMGYMLATVDSGSERHTAGLRVVQPGAEFWSILRFQDASNYWRFGRSSGGEYQLQQVRGDMLRHVALERLATVSPAPGDIIRCQVSSGISCSVNGVVVVRTSDSSLSPATGQGIASWNSPETRLDDVHVLALPREADLAAGITGTRTALVDAAMSFSVTATNLGAATAHGATISGSLPGGSTEIVATPSTGTCSTSGAEFTCLLAALPAGASSSVQLDAKAPPTAGTGTTTATAGTASTDEDDGNNSVSMTTTFRLPSPAVEGWDRVWTDTFDYGTGSTLASPSSPWLGDGRGYFNVAEEAGLPLAYVDWTSAGINRRTWREVGNSDMRVVGRLRTTPPAGSHSASISAITAALLDGDNYMGLELVKTEQGAGPIGLAESKAVLYSRFGGHDVDIAAVDVPLSYATEYILTLTVVGARVDGVVAQSDGTILATVSTVLPDEALSSLGTQAGIVNLYGSGAFLEVSAEVRE
jgi:hypothetical protein